jgi:tripartite-type tricarboxylate transporter receptor subunit TctC
MRRREFLSFVGASAAIWPHSTRAQSFPDRTIRIVAPFPAGGPTDVMARLAAQALQTNLKRTVIVENQPGAGGRIGAKAVAKANPDGTTLLLGGTNINAILPALYKNLDFDAINGFAAIAVVATSSGALAVHPAVPVKTVDELIKYAKANPGALKYGSVPGISPHFTLELFKLRTGADIAFIPYKGAAPAINDALGGTIDVLSNNKSVLLPLLQAGKLRALAVQSMQRWPELPDVPTMHEIGLFGFPAETWYTLVAPATTPAEIIHTLNTATNESLKSKEMRASFTRLGIDSHIQTPEECAVTMADQARQWAEIVKLTGIKIE